MMPAWRLVISVAAGCIGGGVCNTSVIGLLGSSKQPQSPRLAAGRMAGAKHADNLTPLLVTVVVFNHTQ
jgi:hypothetical protein